MQDHNHEPSLRTPKDMLGALSAARNSARMRVHLLSLEARERWHELESRLDRLQARLEHDGERATESAAKLVKELTSSVKELLLDQEVPELQTPAHEVMSKARICLPTNTLSEAAQIMWDADCGSVPVGDEEGTLIGMLTDRDVCMAAYTRGVALSQLSVQDTMAKTAYSCRPTDSVQHVLHLMREHRVKRIPVVDHGRVVGIVALADVARHVEGCRGDTAVASELAHVLVELSQPPTRH